MTRMAWVQTQLRAIFDEFILLYVTLDLSDNVKRNIYREKLE